ncbi:type II toxin-antitoxin system mRNA interferase toxin, RelE/StbE family [Brenneria roseae subsp. americana]|uniref:Type II toxin-antitoxin system mRNA interferase toxin, RelE/StbE family n=1 Tax=Brenneria roseae subsp. americana TaxID=1508507 RepID=A0A2U1TTG8_9GAMM|nr:type II toxin-antitoxin system RelE/ParE family toxin [Brenneria roseae]PWC12706.1 type II toxin-antitoxin system mRNA interferase toxin, RelE/StbE family [Brenneria roseae subsp. americana]
MEILWTQLASQDRRKIREYIAKNNLRAAIELDERISSMAASLTDQPLKARNGRVTGTRELVIHPHFILIYRVENESGEIEIIRILHTAQKWP